MCMHACADPPLCPAACALLPAACRKCLQVLQYMLRVVPLDRRPACDTGLLPALW